MKRVLLLFFLSLVISIVYAQKSIVGKWKPVEMLVHNKKTNKKERNNAGLLPCVVTEFIAGGKVKSDTKTCAPTIQQWHAKLDAIQRWTQQGNKVTIKYTDNSLPTATFTVSFKGKQMIMDHALATTVYEQQ
ncbi:MAG TPA: hypothetical protein PLC89_13755 [Haliscomenobacter sp.]|uniref:hypothetical protein n=1 Tax=Haliscomenobacter sp. TaxID=2717303 RepID=UPI002C79629A|nr:hypothetical protein [Haliscomenobacter sp.]HOY18365.1 hypothetical protein [Haliscomenobacter sp.]HPH22150.1 hypothetical protein [Haliscomenobacter sp.]